MYCRGFSFDLVTRVWDVFFSEGYKIVFRVALALVKVWNLAKAISAFSPRYQLQLSFHICGLSDLYIHLHAYISQYIEKELLDSSFEDILGTFRSIPKLVDAERLMELAWTIPLKRAEIDVLEKQV